MLKEIGGTRLRTEAVRKRVIELKKKYPDLSLRVIAERLGHPYSFIQKVWSEHRKEEVMSIFICPFCRSKGFEKSILKGQCTFCDGTEGGVGPTERR